MYVYANGIRIEGIGTYTPADFFSDISIAGLDSFEHAKHDRHLVVEDRNQYWLGVLISERGQDTIAILKRSGNRLYVRHEKVREGGSVIDFSFFLVSKRTLNGIFTQYKGSGGITMFGNIIRKKFRQHANRKKEIAVQELLEGEPDATVKQQQQGIAGDYSKSKIEVHQLLTTPNFRRELRRLRKISRFEFRIPRVQNRWFQSLGDSIDYEKGTIGFNPQGSTARIRDKIISAVQDQTIEEGTVFGRNANEIQDSVSIEPELTCMNKFPYNDVATDRIELQDVHENEIMRRLISDARTNDRLF